MVGRCVCPGNSVGSVGRCVCPGNSTFSVSQSRKLGRAGWVVTETRSGRLGVCQSRKLGSGERPTPASRVGSQTPEVRYVSKRFLSEWSSSRPYPAHRRGPPRCPYYVSQSVPAFPTCVTDVTGMDTGGNFDQSPAISGGHGLRRVNLDLRKYSINLVQSPEAMATHEIQSRPSKTFGCVKVLAF